MVSLVCQGFGEGDRDDKRERLGISRKKLKKICYFLQKTLSMSLEENGVFAEKQS